MQMQDLKPGQHFMVATSGLRGHFACEMWMNNTDPVLGVFPEPWQSDPETFDTREEAIVWAKELAEIEGLPYIE
jgi:hypothetical protein